jgi:hypothetical protein
MKHDQTWKRVVLTSYQPLSLGCMGLREPVLAMALARSDKNEH